MKTDSGFRAGKYVPQIGGYKSFIPNPIKKSFKLRKDPELEVLLSAADRALARLDASTELLPNPELFIEMYVRKEAVYSSQLEGTQASLMDVLESESRKDHGGEDVNIREIRNYTKAIYRGLDLLKKIPISNRLLKEIHAVLLTGVRGEDKFPGEYRKTQNWIGTQGRPINEANFVPPPPGEMENAMANLERYINSNVFLPPLLKCGLAHAQFETIHPFSDGNGRIGRLLITLILCKMGVMRSPVLYLSSFFRRNQTEYNKRLQDVRDKDAWEDWLKFFLKGVKTVSFEAYHTARDIQIMRDEHQRVLQSKLKGKDLKHLLLSHLFVAPYTTVGQVATHLNRSYPIANNLIRDFIELGLLTQVDSKISRNRTFYYKPYVDLLEAGGKRPPRKF